MNIFMENILHLVKISFLKSCINANNQLNSVDNLYLMSNTF